MNNVLKYRVHQVYVFLREAMPLMILGILVFFGAAIIGFQQDNKRLLEDTRSTAENTEAIVDKQDETLQAIQQLALDNKLTAKQLGDTIICMLLVPVHMRTTETQEQCRQQALNTLPNSNVLPPASPSGDSSNPQAPRGGSNNGGSGQNNPPPEDPPSLLEQALDVVTSPLRNIL